MTARPTACRTTRLTALLASSAVVAALVAVTTPPSEAGPAAAAPTTATRTPISAVDTSGVTRLFHRSPDARLDASLPATVRPERFRSTSVDLGAVEDTLADATRRAPITLRLPAPDGSTEVVSVVEDSVMQAGLQAKYPDMRTYAGTSLTHPGSSVRLDVTPLGFHAFVRDAERPGSSWLIDPAYRTTDVSTDTAGRSTHLSYWAADVPKPELPFLEAELPERVHTPTHADRGAQRLAGRAAGDLVQRRVFRMAFATDPNYATYWGSTDANVLAAKVTMMNRVNEIYNDDVAVKFVLIDGTDTALNFATKEEATGPNGPCGASACYDVDAFYGDGTTTDGVADAPDGCTSALITRNNFVLGQVVGADTYDIGHIGLGVNGGGIAGLGVVGQEEGGLLSSGKATGCTGLPKPQGDFYAIDYVAHEVGHQMGGNHTFNGVQRNCSGGNRNAGTSVEPGSGSSVMAYAGICDNDDLQPHSDPYFSQRSIDEFVDTMTADPVDADEVQTVTLAGFDTDGDSFQLSWPGATAPITITRGALSYRALLVQQDIAGLTGCQVVLGNYDAPNSPAISDDGFTVKFNTDCRGTDQPRLEIGGFTGEVTGFVGVLANGGPSTNGGTVEATTNHVPAVTAPADKTIPVRTPFTLSASGSDVDAGQSLTYLWEQNDVGGTNGTGLVDNAKSAGPLFRVFGDNALVTSEGTLQSPSPGENLATSNPTRTFPDMTQVLADNTNAETGTCPTAPTDVTADVPDAILDCYSEFLPTASYAAELNFRVTARDSFATGGGVNHDDVVLTLDTSAGPLAVTSRADRGTSVEGGSTETITWDVNGTDDAALAPDVKISYSIDGGQTWPYVVATSTPNDGSEAVTVPDIRTNTARVKVEAVGNYFFDVNDADFAIMSSTVPFDTRLRGGPRNRQFVIGSTVTERFGVVTSAATTATASAYRCTVDRLYVPCTGTSHTLHNLKGGLHRFTVAAVVDGIVDPTPAVALFSVVYDQTVLKRSRTGVKGWRIVKAPSYYDGRAFATSRGGTKAVLTRRVAGATRIAVLVARGPGLGKVGVFLNGRRLKVVNTVNRRPQTQALYRVKNGGRPITGTLSIRSLTDKPVVVDGLGVYASDTRNGF